MFPTLIDLGRLDLPFLGETHLLLPTYGFLFAGAVLLGWWWFMRRGRGLGIGEDRLFNLTFVALIGGILGAKLLLILLDARFYIDHPREILGTFRSAGVLAGGVTVGALTFVYYCLRHRLPLWRLGDAVVAPLALAQAMGRLGCFAAGCCWGAPTHADNPWAVVFTDPEAAAQTGVPLNVPLIPTQVIQMAHDLALALLLTWLWHRRIRPDGTVFWVYLLVYSLGRGVIEFWRGDAHRGLYLGGLLSTSQIFALAGFVLAVVMLTRGWWRSRRTAAA